MFDLFLPIILGLALGIEPQAAIDTTVEPTAVAAAPATDLGSGDVIDRTREPEPQVPTGQFTTALEVRPILGMTKSNWVGVREFNGQDLLYFSHLLAWRCGLWDIRFGINGAPADTIVGMEPCNEEFAQPNVMTDIENFPPYVSFPLQSIESIYIEIVFDDGTTDFAQFNRNEIRIP